MASSVGSILEQPDTYNVPLKYGNWEYILCKSNDVQPWQLTKFVLFDKGKLPNDVQLSHTMDSINEKYDVINDNEVQSLKSTDIKLIRDGKSVKDKQLLQIRFTTWIHSGKLVNDVQEPHWTVVT